MAVIVAEIQLDMFNPNEPSATPLEVKKGVGYALVLVVAEIGEHEWQERYLCKYDLACDQALTTQALLQHHHKLLTHGTLVNTAYGPRIKVENGEVWFTYKKIKYSHAKSIIDLGVLPVLSDITPKHTTQNGNM